MFGREKNVSKGKRDEPLPERHEGLPDTEHPGELCPRCDKQSSFDCSQALPLSSDGRYLIGRGEDPMPTSHERAVVLVCRNCGQGVLVLEEQWTGDHRSIEHRGGGVITWRGFHWWPLPGTSLHKAVPGAVRGAFEEAVTALAANCPRAAAVMARRTLEAITTDKGELTGTLAQRLNTLGNKGLLHPTLAEWTKEVRLIGNVGAHFDPIDDVTKEDAQQLVEFIRELAKFLYELPFELNERRKPKP